MLFNLFHEIERQGTLLNSFYEARITFIPNLNKETHTKKRITSISLMNIDAKILKKILVNADSTTH
jgi:hypothetical protein